MTAPMVDYKIHWLKMMSVPESRAVVGRHDGINGRDNYAGVNVFGNDRDAQLAMHPTVKPVAMVEDAILDCSRRGGIVLDPFAGSGTTIIAAERAGRRGYGIEIDPGYIDTALRRYRTFTEDDPVHLNSGRTLTNFEQEV